MLAAGLLLMRGRILGGWIYVVILFCTLVWALWEVGGNGWALVPRVVAPIVLLLLVIFAMAALRSEEHTSELQSLMRISYAVFCLKKKKNEKLNNNKNKIITNR